MIVNRELRAKLREARKTMSPERAELCERVEQRYLNSCQLSLGPDPARSAYWDKRAADCKVELYGFLRPEERPEPAPADSIEVIEEVVGAGKGWY